MNVSQASAVVTQNVERYHIIRRVTVIGGIIDLLLGVVKIVVGKLAFSQSLVADGVHSLSDLATDIMVIWAAKHASREPDEHHPYGHQRIETVATIVLGLMLVAVAGGIAYDSIEDVWRQKALVTPGGWAIVIAALSVLSKEWIYHYTMRVADRVQSEMLRSNAWHSRTDAISSIIVIIGVAGSILGWTYLDAIAAVLVAVMILYIAAIMIRDGVQELIDRGVEPKRLREISQVINKTEGVVDAHDLRTRLMGSNIYLDGHVLVDPKVSVSEGHRIGEAVRQRLKKEFGEITDITIHIDSEDDASYQLSDKLPLRSKLKKQFLDQLREIPESREIEKITLHYLNGKIQAEIWLPLSLFNDLDHAKSTKEKICQILNEQDNVSRVDVLFS